MESGLVSPPKQCTIWKSQIDVLDGLLHRYLKTVHTYLDDSHLIRRLVHCDECGQFYFYEFYEVVDWDAGNDAQYPQ